MRSLLYILAVILIISWVVGSFVIHVASGLIHLLLVVAVILIVINLFRKAT